MEKTGQFDRYQALKKGGEMSILKDLLKERKTPEELQKDIDECYEALGEFQDLLAEYEHNHDVAKNISKEIEIIKETIANLERSLEQLKSGKVS